MHLLRESLEVRREAAKRRSGTWDVLGTIVLLGVCLGSKHSDVRLEKIRNKISFRAMLICSDDVISLIGQVHRGTVVYLAHLASGNISLLPV
jgi:hypothetical protein